MLFINYAVFLILSPIPGGLPSANIGALLPQHNRPVRSAHSDANKITSSTAAYYLRLSFPHFKTYTYFPVLLECYFQVNFFQLAQISVQW